MIDMKKLFTTPKISPLYEGTFSVGLDKKFNPIGRDDPPDKGALKISLNPFLIQAGDRNYLFDVGIGDFGEETSTEAIKQNVAEHDVKVSEITDIFTSHLHYDHIGGLAGKKSGEWQLTFPEAKVWVSKKGWEKAMDMELYYDEEKTEFLHFLNDETNLNFLKNKDSPYPEIKTKTIGGHTEFSQLLLFENEQQKYLMAGDVLATRGEVNRKFEAKYDRDAKKSMHLRKEITKRAYDENYTIMAYHDSHHPLLKLTGYSEQSGYSISNIENYEPA